jgi:2'-5' RNA ligase
MRVFVAVEPGERVRSAAADAAREFQRRLGTKLRARWVPTEKMHLTVRFIGHVDDARVGALLDALRPSLPVAPFDLVTGTCGVFPRSGPPRALWLGLTAGVASLAAMHDEFDRRLGPLGYEPENRPFSAHLTLARVKDAPRGSAALVREALRAIVPARSRSRITHATVFQSVPSPNGASYRPLVTVECEERGTRDEGRVDG